MRPKKKQLRALVKTWWKRALGGGITRAESDAILRCATELEALSDLARPPTVPDTRSLAAMRHGAIPEPPDSYYVTCAHCDVIGERRGSGQRGWRGWREGLCTECVETALAAGS